MAAAQFDFEGGTINTRDFGDGSLDVHYFNEQSASGTGGCLHVEVLSPTGPSPRDRNLEIVFYADFMYGGSRDGTAYRFAVQLPEGKQRAEVAMPYVSPGRANHPGNQIILTLWDVRVLEDGRNVETTRTYSGSRALAPPVKTTRSAGRNMYHLTTSSGSGRSILRLVEDSVVTTSLQPEMYGLMAATDGDANAALSKSIASKTNFGITRDSQNAGNIRTLSSAPEEWLYYLQFHFVVFDEAVLGRMRSERPKVSQALKQYVAAGGSVLLLSRQPGGQKLIDAWLGESTAFHSTASKSAGAGDWQSISAPVEVWWNRNTANVPVITVNQAQTVAGGGMAQPMLRSTSIDGTEIYVNPESLNPLPLAPVPPSDLQASLPANSPTSAATPVVAPETDTENASASLGGFARDLLTALETYSMAEYGTPLVVADKLLDVTVGQGSSTQVSQMGMPQASNYAAFPWEFAELFEPLRIRLESAVAEMESTDASGCSYRPYALGHIGVVQPSLNALPYETLRLLAAQLSNSASVSSSSAHDLAWPWRNLISSVGKPPVWTFCAFVLLFGLLLGPGLLVFTGWMGRRSLLIFLVPFVSLVATILIAGYEILHEGFDTYIRISSLVTIDEPTGQGFAWSRQTYFSGWPPRDGLEFPGNVYFRPVIPQQELFGRDMTEPENSVGNYIDIAEDRSRWTGWLGARQQQQLLIGHPAKASVPLLVTHVDSKHIQLKNLTTENLPFAAVRDGADGYYLALDVQPGAEVNCNAQTAYEVGIELTRVRAKHLPVTPSEMQGNTGLGWGRRYVSFASETSAYEVIDAAWNSYVSEYLNLPRYGFVTLQESSDAIHVPLKGNVTESKHLVVGRLVW